MNNHIKIPTIIFGIGGTGGRIVDQLAGIYLQLDPTHRNNIPTEFLVLDTDVNDINSLKNIPAHKIFRISRNFSIKQYIELHNNGKDIEEWFPTKYQHIHNKTLLEGAGQIRLLGRLALYSMFEIPGFEDRISAEIKNTLKQWHGQLGNLRIYLIGSLCGGTASGILIPLTFWLHHEFQGLHPQIKGIFFLPHIYTDAYNLPQNQHERIKINAYASLKEIENIYRFIGGLFDDDEIGIKPRPMKLQFHPNYPTHLITSGQQFFKLIYLLDYENINHQHLAADGKEYESLVVHGIFNQLYTPIANAQGSIEDNNIIETLQSLGQDKQTNLYCSFGVAALEYPYEDLIKYFAHQYSIYTISQNWLKIDEEFQQRKRNYFMQREQGILNIPEPRLEEEYIAIFEELSQKDAFFNTIYKQFNITIEETRQTLNLAELYIDQLKKHVLNEIKTNNIFNTFEQKYRGGIDVESLKEEADPAQAISTFEHDFEDMELKLNLPGDQISDIIFRKSILVGAELQDTQLLDLHIQRYIRQNSPHPIGVRYFLYKVILQLESEIIQLNKELNTLKKQIEWYKRAFDDPETEEIENAVQRFERIQASNFFKKLFSKGKFLEDYSIEANNHAQRLIRYMEKYALLKLFKKIRDEADVIAEEYETFFDSLSTLINLVQTKIIELENFHDSHQKNSFKHYIFASAGLKKLLWDQEKINLPALQDPQINLEIYEMVFNKTYLARYRTNLPPSRRQKIQATYPRKFMEILIPQCLTYIRSKIGGKYNLNIAEIIRYQLQLENPDMNNNELRDLYSTTIKNILSSLMHRAEGYIQVVNKSDTYDMLFLGIHKNVWDFLKGNIADFSDFLTQQSGQQTITDSFFSDKIIQAYRVRFNLISQNLNLFKFPKGEYFSAYQKCVKLISSSLNPERSPKDVFPHLDKNWHKYGYLPGLSIEEMELYNSMKITAILGGRLTNTLEVVPSHRGNNEVIVACQFTGNLREETFIPKHSPSSFHLLNYYMDEIPGNIPKFLKEYQNWFSNSSNSLNSQYENVLKELINDIKEERGNPEKQKFLYYLVKHLVLLNKHYIFSQSQLTERQKYNNFKNIINNLKNETKRQNELHEKEKNNVISMIDSTTDININFINKVFNQTLL